MAGKGSYETGGELTMPESRTSEAAVPDAKSLRAELGMLRLTPAAELMPKTS